jgi:Tfp pilus assembly protein PilV
MPHTRHAHLSGFALIESILSVSLIVGFVSIFIMVSVYTQNQTLSLSKRTHALFLAEEGLEVARALRNNNTASLVDGVYGLAQSGGTWIFSGSGETIGDFRRTVTITSIAPSTKEITATVVWTERIDDHTISLSTLLTEWK